MHINKQGMQPRWQCDLRSSTITE